MLTAWWCWMPKRHRLAEKRYWKSTHTHEIFLISITFNFLFFSPGPFNQKFQFFNSNCAICEKGQWKTMHVYLSSAAAISIPMYTNVRSVFITRMLQNLELLPGVRFGLVLMSALLFHLFEQGMTICLLNTLKFKQPNCLVVVLSLFAVETSFLVQTWSRDSKDIRGALLRVTWHCLWQCLKTQMSYIHLFSHTTN